MSPVPARSRIGPARLFSVKRGSVVVVHEPIGVGIDVHVADLVPQTGPEQVIGDIRSGVGQTSA